MESEREGLVSGFPRLDTENGAKMLSARSVFVIISLIVIGVVVLLNFSGSCDGKSDPPPIPLIHPTSEVKSSGQMILVTGGSGFIGSHTVLELLLAGFQVAVVDNLANSYETSLHRVGEILLYSKPESFRRDAIPLWFYKLDLVTDGDKLDTIFAIHKPVAVIHFAGLKAVGESMEMPVEYFETNLGATLTVLDVMQNHGCSKLIFSSSATVYGLGPFFEDALVTSSMATNPYGRSKFLIEEILRDVGSRDLTNRHHDNFDFVILRYFNPVGAHPTGIIGEHPKGKKPNNVMPLILKAAVGESQGFSILGTDYNTTDGTGVRDYIHVVDLAQGHVAALQHDLLVAGRAKGTSVYNLGSGSGFSVRQLVDCVSKYAGKFPVNEGPRRPGDIAVSIAQPERALTKLQWKTKIPLDQVCQDSWRWQCNHPEGFFTQPGGVPKLPDCPGLPFVPVAYETEQSISNNSPPRHSELFS